MDLTDLHEALDSLAAEPASPAADPLPGVRTAVARARRRRRRRRLALVAGTAAVGLVVLAGGLVAASRDSGTRVATGGEVGPTAVPMDDVLAMRSAGDRVWVLTDARLLSSAGGVWTATPANATALDAVDDERAVVAGPAPDGRGVLVGTTDDGGRTLVTTSLADADGSGPLSLDFVDAANGVLACSGELWRTADGGGTWTHVADGAPADIRFVDADLGFGAGPGLRRTSDGGRTWQDVDVDTELEPYGPGQGFDTTFLLVSATPDSVVVEAVEPLGMTVRVRLLRSGDGGGVWGDITPPEVFDPHDPYSGTGPQPRFGVGADGRLWGYDGRVVYEQDPAGWTTTAADLGFDAPAQVAVGADGGLWVADRHVVYRSRREGPFLGPVAGFPGPTPLEAAVARHLTAPYAVSGSEDVQNGVQVDVAGADGSGYQIALYERFDAAELDSAGVERLPASGGTGWLGSDAEDRRSVYFLADSGVGLYVAFLGTPPDRPSVQDLLALAGELARDRAIAAATQP